MLKMVRCVCFFLFLREHCVTMVRWLVDIDVIFFMCFFFLLPFYILLFFHSVCLVVFLVILFAFVPRLILLWWRNFSWFSFTCFFSAYSLAHKSCVNAVLLLHSYRCFCMRVCACGFFSLFSRLCTERATE